MCGCGYHTVCGGKSKEGRIGGDRRIRQRDIIRIITARYALPSVSVCDPASGSGSGGNGSGSGSGGAFALLLLTFALLFLASCFLVPVPAQEACKTDGGFRRWESDHDE